MGIQHQAARGHALVTSVKLWVAVLTALTSLCGHAQATVFSVEEIAPGVHVHMGEHEQMSVANNGDTSNSGFIVGSRSVAVIDPGGSVAVAQSLKEAIKRRTNLPISHLILTHFHPDHVTGASVFSDVPAIIAHQHYSRAVAQRAKFYLQRFSSLVAERVPATFGMPTQWVKGTMKIDLGGRMLVLTAHPTAHTDNDLTVFDLLTQTLWASDIVFVERMPSLDGSLIGWLNVLRNLPSDEIVKIVPGHGRPSEWKYSARLQINYLEGLYRDVKAALEKGMTLSRAIKPGAIPVVGSWVLTEQQHPTNITKAYTELEWE